MNAIDRFTDATITDASWKEIVATSLKQLRDTQNVLVDRLRAKIEGTAADKNYTATTLLKSLHNWVALTDEPFDQSLGHAPSTQNATYRDFITSPVTPTPALPILSQPLETDLGAPTLEPSTSDHTPDELRKTTKDLAKDEVKDSGFLFSIPSPDDWLNTLPTDSAVVSPQSRVADVDTQKTLEVKVEIDRLLTMTETKFVNRYITDILKMTTETSCGWLKKIAEACQQRFKRLMLDRKEKLNQRRGGREETKGQVVRHLMAIANLTAANAAIEKLQDAVKEWDRLLKSEEDADILVASI